MMIRIPGFGRGPDPGEGFTIEPDEEPTSKQEPTGTEQEPEIELQPPEPEPEIELHPIFLKVPKDLGLEISSTVKLIYKQDENYQKRIS